MKLTKNTYTKVKPGVTLIELTVVILVLLTLIGVLFVGAQIYKEGADRSACILNIRNIQLAIRSNQNLDETIDQGDPILLADIFSSGSTENYLSRPQCPLTPDEGYTLITQYPATGNVVATCDPNGLGNGTGDHFPTRTAGW